MVFCRVASQRAALPAFPASPLRTERATLTALRSPVSVNSVLSHRKCLHESCDDMGVIRFCVTAELCEEKSTDGFATGASFGYASVSSQPASLNWQHPVPSQAEIVGFRPLTAIGSHVWRTGNKVATRGRLIIGR